MAFELSFSSEFFIGYEENFDDLLPEKSDTPTSVLQALVSIPEDDWKEMCKDIFDCDPDYVDLGMVMAKIRETDTCTDLRPPVNVWIDEEGWWSVGVYDREDG